MSAKRHGRRKPYTEIGIRRLPCYRCGSKPARYQWKACFDGLYHPLCSECDIDLNKIVIFYMHVPRGSAKFRAYRKRIHDEIFNEED